MPATILAIADAVVATLNAATLSLGFQAERGYVPLYDVPAGEGLKVFVTTPDLTPSPLARRWDDYDFGIHVGIFRKLPPGLTTLAEINARCDPLVALNEEIMDLFRGKRLATHDEALCLTASCPAVFHHEMLESRQLYAGLVRLVFRQTRART